MYILIEQVDYEGGSFFGAYATLEAAILATGTPSEGFERSSIDDCWRQPAGGVARWEARKRGHDVTFIIWEVRV